MMHSLIPLLWLAGLIQVAIASANFFLPKKLQYRENLEKVAPFIRQIFVVHSTYIVGFVLFFAVVTFWFAGDLISGHGLGRFLAAVMALFWLARIPLQLFYYDASVRRAHRLGDVAMTLALFFLGGVYAAAAFLPAH
jgi:hypothetical protein